MATANTTSTNPTMIGLSQEQLNGVVDALKTFMSKDDIRQLNQRAVQAKAWHLVPEVAAVMAHLRQEEEYMRAEIMRKMSALVYGFHDNTLDATLARAGLLSDARVHAGSSLDYKDQFDLLCLDSKERMYLIFKQYGWLQDFFRQYPQHFYENSFRFVDMIPQKTMPVSVNVVGLGIGGSLAVSGLAKVGIQAVTGYELRARGGAHGVDSRYQNASWRAYDISERMLDEEAFEHLCDFRQRINVTYDDGSSKVLTTDRVQIIIGDAVNSALQSAERYGAKLCFNSPASNYFSEEKEVAGEEGDEADGSALASSSPSPPAVDIVALFCGAHTSALYPGLKEEMEIVEYGSELSSECRMWLRIRESAHNGPYCTRGGEIGATKWHYTIDSARDAIEDIVRVKNALDSQFKITDSTTDLPEEYVAKRNQLSKVLDHMRRGNSMKYHASGATSVFGFNSSTSLASIPAPRFDYIFTNAPDNEYNREKRAKVGVDGTVVFDGGYRVDIKMARRCVVGGVYPDSAAKAKACKVLKKFNASVLVTGGDACVPPNPLAAYGATLACEAADMLVQLAVAHAHINAVIQGLSSVTKADFEQMDDTSEWCTELHVLEDLSSQWIPMLNELKNLFSEFYNVRGRAENYFQWIQTLICNLYSLPPLA